MISYENISLSFQGWSYFHKSWQPHLVLKSHNFFSSQTSAFVTSDYTIAPNVSVHNEAVQYASCKMEAEPEYNDNQWQAEECV